ncbi:hypothetical protein GCM10010510_57890 [Streptomyces anandii JCM 4720]|nr:hypothetical protein GCM10010510_57890 [Streptomyces anandii JCM 4720]
MYDAHAARAEARLQAVVAGVLRKFRFHARSAAALWRHGTTPVLFVRARDAPTLVDDSNGTQEAC